MQMPEPEIAGRKDYQWARKLRLSQKLETQQAQKQRQEEWRDMRWGDPAWHFLPAHPHFAGS